MSGIKYFILSLIFMVLFLSFLANNNKRFNVLHISSYNPDYAWDMEQERGINKAFFDKNISYNYKVFYLDTKNHLDKDWIFKRSKLAIEYIKKTDPDVIIVSDDNAAKYVAARMKNTKYKFVFTGLNSTPETYGLPASNITGVIERHLFENNIKLLKLLNPKINRIDVLTDNSETSKSMVEQFKEIVPSLPVKVVGIHLVNTFEEWQTEVMKHQKNKDVDARLIILYQTLKDKYGNRTFPEDVMRWTINYSKIPEISTFDFIIQDGGLASVSITGYGQGYLAGIKAVQILKGESPSKIKIEKSYNSAVLINTKRAKALNLNLPPNISYKELSSNTLILKY